MTEESCVLCGTISHVEAFIADGHGAQQMICFDCYCVAEDLLSILKAGEFFKASKCVIGYFSKLESLYKTRQIRYSPFKRPSKGAGSTFDLFNRSKK